MMSGVPQAPPYIADAPPSYTSLFPEPPPDDAPTVTTTPVVPKPDPPLPRAFPRPSAPGRHVTSDTDTSNTSTTPASSNTSTTPASSTASTAPAESPYKDTDKYGFYNEVYRCIPFLEITDDQPKTCNVQKKLWFASLVVTGVVVAVLVIALSVTLSVLYSKGCEERCSDGTCYRTRQRCDGNDDCSGREDEHTCEPKLRNVANKVVGITGRDVTIRCHAVIGASSVVEWTSESESGDTVLLWNSDKRTNKVDGFEVFSIPGNQFYDLNILQLQANQSGLGFGVGFHGRSKQRVDVIAAEAWTCNIDHTVGEVINQGDSITLTASVVFYGTNEPKVIWYFDKVPLEADETSEFDGQRYNKTVTHTTTAIRGHHGKKFEALLLRRFPVNRYNANNYAARCSTVYNVLHGARNVRIEYTNDQNDSSRTDLLVVPGSGLTCSAGGLPVPNLKWSCNNGDYVSYGSVFTVPTSAPHNMDCRCRAENYIDGVDHSASENVQFITYNGSPKPTVDIGVALFVLGATVLFRI